MPAITPELLTRFDVPGPRYTSYPTADRFVEAFGEPDYLRALAQRRSGRGPLGSLPRIIKKSSESMMGIKSALHCLRMKRWIGYAVTLMTTM